MSKRLSLASFCFFVALLCLASTPLPELFQKAKEQFRQGSYSEALKTLDEMARRSTEPENEKYRAGMAPALAFYRGACLAALGRNDEARAEFETYLASQPNAQLDPTVYPKSVIAALEDARHDLDKKKETSVEQGSIAADYQAFRYAGGQIEPDSGEEPADGPVRDLMSPEEQRAFAQMTNPVARHEFVTKFWASRSGFRAEFERRVAFADTHFSQDDVRGSLTDRGVVFVLLGPPTYIGRQPIRTGEDTNDASGMSRYTPNDVAAVQKTMGPSAATNATIDRMTGPTNTMPDTSMRWREIWHYRKELLPKNLPYQEVDFEFITREGYGNNVLQRNATSLNALDAARRALESPALKGTSP